MTSNDGPAPAPGPPAGRRRALGRGPGAHALPAEAARGAPEPAGTPRPHEPSADTDGPPPSTPDLPSRPPEPAAPDPGTEAEAEAQVSPPEPEAKAEPAVSVPGPETLVSEPEPELSGPEPETSAPEPPAPEPPAPVPAPVGPEPPVRVAGAAGDADSSGADVAGDGDDEGGGVFKVRLANFEGPFDLLLQLISRHKMDVTEVALSRVTDEFMAYIRAMGSDWDLDETTEFLVVAATLLDLKAARLLPAAEVEDEADLALLEARDLLFARLLQYRAYKQVADIFNRRLDEEARRHPRTVGLEPHHAELLPEVVISIGPEGFARLAVKAMQPRPRPQVYVDHIHAPLVSVQEQAGIVVARLRERGEADFRELVADTDDTLTVVARFLALLELYREKAVALEQETALGDLLVRWTGGAGEAGPTVTDEFDRAPRPPKEEKA
ncbi:MULTISPECIES: segregation and condensation protein A [Streptomyces]|uniref:Segregation and condensation protein A n=1 Tax=Streptomyces doudnae TaxID=3075536 RepID=A0ABD5ETM7_9ACTN|nr:MULTISPECIES: segregation/condensation protein A [unclassified Streptomyces]MDT0437613.1 segregation/condensation protein A [Streptomyces sp. DSM 41981]MYQ63653.1 segregation/condensation protein A [Streptomyces sp. SID4950]SCD62530.1 condensin subunit ScpA [Streptomyces sp. SolWspMP-5a-2]